MDAVSNIKIIPQVFYDVIARIMPGSVGIWALTTASNIKTETILAGMFDGSGELRNSKVVFVLAFLIGAYLLGHLISTLGDSPILKWVLSKPLRSFSDVLEKTYRELCTSRLQERVNGLVEETIRKAALANVKVADSPHEQESTKSKPVNPNWEAGRLDPKVAALYLWYDGLRVLNPDVGSRLAKLRAEYHMRKRIAQILALAFMLHTLLWFLTRIHVPGLKVAWNWYLFGFSLAGFYVCRRAATRSCATFQRSVINHYLVLYDKLNESKETRGARKMGRLTRYEILLHRNV